MKKEADCGDKVSKDSVDEIRRGVTVRWRVLSWSESIARSLAWDGFCEEAT